MQAGGVMALQRQPLCDPPEPGNVLLAWFARGVAGVNKPRHLAWGELAGISRWVLSSSVQMADLEGWQCYEQGT